MTEITDAAASSISDQGVHFKAGAGLQVLHIHLERPDSVIMGLVLRFSGRYAKVPEGLTRCSRDLACTLRGQALWPCGKWLWLNSCVSWVRIPASPTYWLEAEESGGVEEGDGWESGFFGAITTGCMRPICTLKLNEK